MGGGREPAQVMVMEAGEPAAEKQVKRSCRAEWGADALFPFLCYDVLDVLC